MAPATGRGGGGRELRRRLKVVSEHEDLFGRVLCMAAEAGVVERVSAGGSSWRVVLAAGEALPDRELEDPPALAAALAELHPSGAIEFGLLSRCGAALAEVLRGRVEPLGLLFDDAGSGAAELYRDAPAESALSRLLAAAVSAAAAGLPGERRLRVLEVGAGTGGTTGAVLSALPADRFEYTCTDVSAGFFTGARERFGEEHRLEQRLLDIERDPAAQGFSTHAYDVVIAANVLHATRHVGRALDHCRRLLAPGGMLAALEVFRAQGWLDLTFGMLEGWWHFAEGADGYREDYPLMAPGDWRRALRDAGFEAAAVVGEAEGALQGVVLARGPSEVEEAAGLWVVASDEGGEGPELAARLAGRNQRVVLAVDASRESPEEAAAPGVEVARVDASSRAAWRGLLERLPGEPRGVVHLAALSGHGNEAGAAELAEDVKRAAGSALALAQGLLDAGVELAGGTWLVTRGGQVVDREAGGELTGASLWGLGRTLALEAGQLAPRMVDLDPEEDRGFGGLVEELLNPDRETEVAYRRGTRWGLRLVRGGAAQPQGEPAEGREAPEAAWPGGLREDGTYLVTGGLGGIGLGAAAWLADGGARSIVLNGRREPEEEALAAVEALRQRGVDVRVELADVTDEDAVARMLQRVDAAMPPLAGVVHGAGVSSDASVANQDRERFERVLWPKMLGSVAPAPRDRGAGPGPVPAVLGRGRSAGEAGPSQRCRRQCVPGPVGAASAGVGAGRAVDRVGRVVRSGRRPGAARADGGAAGSRGSGLDHAASGAARAGPFGARWRADEPGCAGGLDGLRGRPEDRAGAAGRGGPDCGRRREGHGRGTVGAAARGAPFGAGAAAAGVRAERVAGGAADAVVAGFRGGVLRPWNGFVDGRAVS